MFVALAGRRDGHDFVAAAIANKAALRHRATGLDRRPTRRCRSCASTTRSPPCRRSPPGTGAQLDAHVVAVVGSLGKTTTKDALVSFLGESTFCYGSPGSFNSQLGVPLSVLWCPADAELAVFEAAATEPGEMARLVDVAAARTRSSSRRSATASGAASASVAAYAAELCALAATADRVVCGDTAVDLADHLPSRHGAADARRRRGGRSTTVARPAHGDSDDQRRRRHASTVPDVVVVGRRRRRPRRRHRHGARPPAGGDDLRADVGRPARRGARRPASPSCGRRPSTSRWRGAPRSPTRSTPPAGGGRVVVVLSDAAHEMSDETLSTLAGDDGRAVVVGARHGRPRRRRAGPTARAAAGLHVGDALARGARRRGDGRRRRGGDHRARRADRGHLARPVRGDGADQAAHRRRGDGAQRVGDPPAVPRRDGDGRREGRCLRRRRAGAGPAPGGWRRRPVRRVARRRGRAAAPLRRHRARCSSCWRRPTSWPRPDAPTSPSACTAASCCAPCSPTRAVVHDVHVEVDTGMRRTGLAPRRRRRRARRARRRRRRRHAG